MKYQYYTKFNVPSYGLVLTPYSGVFNTKRESLKWKLNFLQKAEKRTLTYEKLILAEAIEEQI